MTSSDQARQDFAKPESITGGCLCGSIRYKVEFPKDHDFLDQSESCQCTQCRRNAGALIWHTHCIPFQSWTYTAPTPTLKNFSATEGVLRGFCSQCGSFLYYRDESLATINFSVGTVDPEYLFGEGAEHDGYGYALASCSGDNVYCENEIEGVTKGWVGKTGRRWAKGSKYGVKA